MSKRKKEEELKAGHETNSTVSVQGRFGGIRVLGLTAVGLAFE
jgi:hypothetical protein